MNEEVLYIAVKRLVGNINPLGCSSRDEERLENMKFACGLVNSLLVDIYDVVSINRGSYEHSVKEIANYAEKFIDDLGIQNL